MTKLTSKSTSEINDMITKEPARNYTFKGDTKPSRCLLNASETTGLIIREHGYSLALIKMLNADRRFATMKPFFDAIIDGRINNKAETMREKIARLEKENASLKKK